MIRNRATRSATPLIAAFLISAAPPAAVQIMAENEFTPGARQQAAGWSDDEGGLWLFGGDGYYEEGSRDMLNDLWRYDTDTGEWSWQHGSDTGDHEGTYGDRGVPHPDNQPGARYDGISVTGDAGEIWLFGGVGLAGSSWSADLNDLWQYDPATGEWTWVGGTNERNEAGHYGTLGEPDPENVPGGRSYRPASWATASGEIWLFGGGGRDSQGDWDRLNDLWRYDPASEEWTWMAGSQFNSEPGAYGDAGTPGDAYRPGARLAPAHWTRNGEELWLFGGDGIDSQERSGRLADLWKYDTGANQWTFVKGSPYRRESGEYGVRGVPAPDNMPGARDYSASWTDDAGNLWLFGGFGYDEEGDRGRLNDLWRYDPTSNEWTWMSGAAWRNATGNYGTQGEADPANTPGARYGAVSWTGNDGGLWLFGGSGYNDEDRGRLNDLWRYDTSTEEWTWVAGSDSLDQPGVYGPVRSEWRQIGDFNNDGCVDFEDFIFLLQNWGEMIDGIPMGFEDFNALLENWGQGPDC